MPWPPLASLLSVHHGVYICYQPSSFWICRSCESSSSSLSTISAGLLNCDPEPSSPSFWTQFQLVSYNVSWLPLLFTSQAAQLFCLDCLRGFFARSFTGYLIALVRLSPWQQWYDACFINNYFSKPMESLNRLSSNSERGKKRFFKHPADSQKKT